MGLDVEARRGLWARIRGFAKRGGSVLLTTHYLDEADALSHRIAVLAPRPDRGRRHAGRNQAAGRVGGSRRRVSGHHWKPERLSRRLRKMSNVYLLEAKMEFLKSLRMKAYSLTTVLFPIMFYCFFGLAMGQ